MQIVLDMMPGRKCINVWAVVLCAVSLKITIGVGFPVHSSISYSKSLDSLASGDSSYFNVWWADPGDSQISENNALVQFDEPIITTDISRMEAMEIILIENKKIPEATNRTLIEGDIMLRKTHPNITNAPHQIDKRNALRAQSSRWPEGVVPYIIDEAYDNNAALRIKEGMEKIENVTCINFVRRENQADYVHILPNEGCWSEFGRIGGKQELSLDGPCTENQGVIQHELMHALGFSHEHSRADRDDFVNILLDNIEPDQLRNFEKYNRTYIDHLDTTYDYRSIMHYQKNTFSRNGLPTIEAKETGVTIGNRLKLSPTDVREVQRYYKCPCEDRNADCKRWFKEGRCQTEAYRMNRECPKSCKICGRGSRRVCKDRSDYCTVWKDRGNCDQNSTRRKCRKSCEVCTVDD